MSKKEQILDVALRLFAENGFDRTPTSRIAREAQVSEGLIFLHYQSKAGLLQAIIQQGKEQVDESMLPYQRDLHPRQAIVQHIRESFRLVRQHTTFWRLVHQMRHQPAVQTSAEREIEDFNQGVVAQLAAPFRALGAPQPEQEALLLFALIDGITMQYLQAPERYPLDTLEQFLINKYEHENYLDQP